VTLTTHQQV